MTELKMVADCAVLNTAVSSKMLASMAEKEGLYYEVSDDVITYQI